MPCMPIMKVVKLYLATVTIGLNIRKDELFPTIDNGKIIEEYKNLTLKVI